MNEREALWAGPFGREYTERNRVDWRARRSFWDLMLETTRARTVLEVGCNAGWNLLALRDSDPTLKLRGIDVNEEAVAEARAEVLDARVIEGERAGTCWPGRFDLVFTAGVLIHVAPEDLPAMMVSIINASSKWVLAVEYEDSEEREIEYRGHMGRLWKRPFGLQYESLGLDLEAYGTLAPGDGFDQCSYWLLRKPEVPA